MTTMPSTPRVHLLDFPDEILEQILSYALADDDGQPKLYIDPPPGRRKEQEAVRPSATQPSALSVVIQRGRQQMQANRSKQSQPGHFESRDPPHSKASTIHPLTFPVQPRTSRAEILRVCRRFQNLGIRVVYQRNTVHCSSFKQLRRFASRASQEHRELVRSVAVIVPWSRRFVPSFNELHLNRSDLSQCGPLLEGLPNLEQLLVKCEFDPETIKERLHTTFCIAWARGISSRLPWMYRAEHLYIDIPESWLTTPDVREQVDELLLHSRTHWDEELRKLGGRWDGKDIPVKHVLDRR